MKTVPALFLAIRCCRLVIRPESYPGDLESGLHLRVDGHVQAGIHVCLTCETTGVPGGKVPFEVPVTTGRVV